MQAVTGQSKAPWTLHLSFVTMRRPPPPQPGGGIAVERSGALTKVLPLLGGGGEYPGFTLYQQKGP